MVLKEDVGGSETHDLNALPGQSDTRCNDNRPLSGSTNRDPNSVPAISQDDGRCDSCVLAETLYLKSP